MILLKAGATELVILILVAVFVTVLRKIKEYADRQQMERQREARRLAMRTAAEDEEQADEEEEDREERAWTAAPEDIRTFLRDMGVLAGEPGMQGPAQRRARRPRPPAPPLQAETASEETAVRRLVPSQPAGPAAKAGEKAAPVALGMLEHTTLSPIQRAIVMAEILGWPKGMEGGFAEGGSRTRMEG